MILDVYSRAIVGMMLVGTFYLLKQQRMWVLPVFASPIRMTRLGRCGTFVDLAQLVLHYIMGGKGKGRKWLRKAKGEKGVGQLCGRRRKGRQNLDQISLRLLFFRRYPVSIFWRLRSKKLFFPIMIAASTIRSFMLSSPLYFHLVAINLKWVSTCFMHMGKLQRSSILQSLRIFSRMSQSFLPIFSGSFEQIRRYRSIPWMMIDSSPMVSDLFLPVPYISLKPFSISLSWQILEHVYGISTFISSPKGRQIQVLSQWLRQSFQARMVLQLICLYLPKICLQTTSDCPLMMSNNRKSLLLNRAGPFSCSSGLDWMSNSSEPTEFILFLDGGYLRLEPVKGLTGVTSRELRKLLMPRKLEFYVQLLPSSSRY